MSLLFASKPQLSEEQQKVHDTILQYVYEEPGYKMLLVEGYAGTGKTFTITRTIEDIMSGNFGPAQSIAMTAPTHKAVRVLKRFSEFKSQVTFATIHALLGLKEQVDDRGNIKYVEDKDPNNPPRIDGMDIVILDEASMLPDELFHLLVPYVNRGLRLIFVGDPIQIPPVGAKDSIPFNEAKRTQYSIHREVLSQIMRQAEGNPILQYATDVRKSYKDPKIVPVSTHTIEGNGIICISQADEAKTVALITEYFDSPQFRENADHMKVVAWRNVVVNQYNDLIRKIVYKTDKVNRLMLGEKLVMDKAFADKSGRVLLHNNEEIEIKEINVTSGDFNYIGARYEGNDIITCPEFEKLRYYECTVEYYDDMNKLVTRRIPIIHEDDEVRLETIRKDIVKFAKLVPFGNPDKNRLWRSYYAVERMFAQVKYNYAITAHKSQGSTYDNCMVALWDLQYNRNVEERNRIIYVSATRPKNKLFILQ